MADSTDPIIRLNAALEGRYRIEREIGEGGMATVYLAEDLRHERKVALKVLKPELAAVVGAERFLAEIKTTANLQHPHILPLHDSGEADGFLYFVMPYIEGDTLRDKIDREKQLSVADALKITEKVAEALDYAHEHGVVHRDIKPGNILLSERGEPTVADFGIALAVAQAGGGRVTETGLSIGTPHYMSPEQATGDRDVDPRTDVYALGCVLYEMLIGEPPYTGSTAQAILGKIIQGNAISATDARSTVPPNVDAAIRKALEKLPADRFASAQDLLQALSDPGFRHGDQAGVELAVRSQWTPVAKAASAVAVVAIAFGAWSSLAPAPPQPLSRQVLGTRGWNGLEAQLGRYTALAPDGSSMIVPVGNQLALKTRGSIEITPIPGTEGARDPVFSPDGEWIAYSVLTDLFKRPLVGGSPVRIAEDAPSTTGLVGLSWLDDGTILYEQFGEAEDVSTRRVARISEDGGEPLDVVFGVGSEQVAITWVHGLPGARGALVVSCPGQNCPGDETQLLVLNLEDLSSEVLFEQVLRAWYVPTGHIVYVRNDGAVLAQPFDLGALELRGSAVPLFEGVRVTSGTASDFPDMQLASDGTVLYVEGPANEALAGLSDLVLVDRSGQELTLGVEPETYLYPRASPDGSRLAVAISEGGDTDLWVLDLGRGSRSRITFGGNNRYFPVWTPQGDRLTYSELVGTRILNAPADGSRGVESLIEGGEALRFPTSWSPDGQALAYHQRIPPDLQRDIWMLPAGGDPEPFLATPFQEHAPSFSPDGRWLAYVSDESGQDEVYVRPYPGSGPQFTVSVAGGREPVWSPDGSELFYRTENELMVVAVDLAGTFNADPPRPLFSDDYSRDDTGAFSTPNYDVMPDGQAFVMVRPAAIGSANPALEGEGSAVILVQNFFEELRQVPE